MKLIFCPTCQDMIKLQLVERSCICGASRGRYMDMRNAEIGGRAIAIGLSSASLSAALRDRHLVGDGADFVAFVMPQHAVSIMRRNDNFREDENAS